MKNKKEKLKYSFNTIESHIPDQDDVCHYSGLPSPLAYGDPDIDMDGMGDQGRTVKFEYKKNKVMKQLEKYYPIILAFISFLFSVTLWFAGYKDEGMFVGIWVPSILGLANFFNTVKK